MTTPSTPAPLTPAGAANVTQTASNSGTPLIPRSAFNTTTTRELAEAMTEPPSPGSVSRRWGIIDSINDAPDFTVNVSMGGIVVPDLAYDAAYTPTVGEVVMLDVVGGDTVVIGTTAPGTWRTGDIEPSFLPVAKPGTMICQGQTLDRTKYVNLWNWVQNNNLVGPGLPFGPGDGSTTFTIPDLRGRVAIGAGTLGTDTYNLGDLPGAARVTLATNQMPSHNHNVSVTESAHTHTFSATTGSAGNHTHSATTGTQNQNHDHTVPSAYTGSTTHSHGSAFPGYASEGPNPGNEPAATITTSGNQENHNHNFTTDNVGAHTHSVSGTSGSTTSTASVSQATVGGTTPVDVRQPAFVVNWLLWY